MVIIRNKIEEHWGNRDGDTATIISRQDGATLNLLKHNGETFSKDYATRRGAAVAMHYRVKNMRFLCMTDHMEVNNGNRSTKESYPEV